MVFGVPTFLLGVALASELAPTPHPLPMLSTVRWQQVSRLVQALDPSPPLQWTSATLRAMVEAVLYRALSETDWASLPGWAPPRSAVQATYDRWRISGLLDRLSAALAIELRIPDTAGR